jgi:hypothetical protein
MWIWSSSLGVMQHYITQTSDSQRFARRKHSSPGGWSQYVSMMGNASPFTTPIVALLTNHSHHWIAMAKETFHRQPYERLITETTSKQNSNTIFAMAEKRLQIMVNHHIQQISTTSTPIHGPLRHNHVGKSQRVPARWPQAVTVPSRCRTTVAERQLPRLNPSSNGPSLR